MTSGFQRVKFRHVIQDQRGKKESGNNSGEDTPVPISNTVVKLLSADDTWRGTAWESRSLPVLLKKKLYKVQFLFLRSVQNETAEGRKRM